MPADDITRFGDAVQRTAAHVAKLSGAADPDEHAAALVAAFLPDVLRYRRGTRPARAMAAACTTTRSAPRYRCWPATSSG